MASVSASMATLAFNKSFSDLVEYTEQKCGLFETEEEYERYKKKFFKAMFDSRVFTIPVDEVCNCLIWRQQDAIRNSIESVGQANFSHGKLHGKTCNDVQEMLWNEKQINWNNFPTDCKRGSACYRIEEKMAIPEHNNINDELIVRRSRWIVDTNIPIFTQDRDFVERWL